MSYSKRQMVEAALAEVGLGSYAFDLSVDQFDQAIRRLDAMMASWSAKGVRVGYPMPSGPDDSDSTSDTQVPDSAWEAIITNLAVRLAPSYGKLAATETKVIATNTYHMLLSKAAMPDPLVLAQLPVGTGAKSLDTPYSLTVEEDLGVGPGGPLEFN